MQTRMLDVELKDKRAFYKRRFIILKRRLGFSVKMRPCSWLVFNLERELENLPFTYWSCALGPCNRLSELGVLGSR